jgi:deferrochelatase/peroxidase EfeB
MAGPGTSLGQQTIPFHGTHQAGIITPAQDRLAFGTMNVVSGTSRADLRDLLRVWTVLARMAAR